MLRSIALLCAFFVCAITANATPAWAEKRVALVIGNGAYDNVSPLPNPVNDSATRDCLSSRIMDALASVEHRTPSAAAAAQ